MKRMIRFALCAGAFIHTFSPLHAASPTEGPYMGGTFGATYSPNYNFTYNDLFTNINLPSGITIPSNISTSGTGALAYEVLIDAGIHLGYRFCENYRLELEAVYNKNPYNFLRIGDYTFYNYSTSTGWRVDGATTSGFGFFNGFYDFLGDGTSSTVPFVGLGIGYAYVYNAVKFYYNEQLVNPTNTSARTHAGLMAGQAIIGFSYFMDDYFSVGLDARYYATTKGTITNPYNDRKFNTQLQVYAINMFFNGVLELD